MHIDILLSRPRSLANISDEMTEVMHVLIGTDRIASGLVACRPVECPHQPDAYRLWFRTVKFRPADGHADYSYAVEALRGNGTGCTGHFHGHSPTGKVRYHIIRLTSIPTDHIPDAGCGLKQGELDDRLKIVDSCFFTGLRHSRAAA